MSLLSKPKIAAWLLAFAPLVHSNETVKREDLITTLEYGWSVAGDLKACSYITFDTVGEKFGPSSYFTLMAQDVERESIRLARTSREIDAGYAEIQISKVWFTTKIQGDYLLRLEKNDPKQTQEICENTRKAGAELIKKMKATKYQKK